MTMLMTLDIREHDQFVQCHLKGSGWIPAGDLGACIHELPPPSQALRIVGGNEGDLDVARTFFAQHSEYRVVEWCLFSSIMDENVLERQCECVVSLWQPSPLLAQVEWFDDFRFLFLLIDRLMLVSSSGDCHS